MGDDLSLKERDAVRTPMQWTNEPQAGFSTARKLVLPVIDKGRCRYDHVNVAAQRRDPGSLLSWTACMIRIRKECPEIGWGDWQILATGSPGILAMRYDWRGNSVVVVHNFAEKAHEARIKPGVPNGDKLVNLLVKDRALPMRPALITLPSKLMAAVGTVSADLVTCFGAKRNNRTECACQALF